MIGMLQLLMELGCVDTIIEVSVLSSHNVSPRAGHLEAAHRICEYLFTHVRGGYVVFDDSVPEVVESKFKPIN